MSKLGLLSTPLLLVSSAPAAPLRFPGAFAERLARITDQLAQRTAQGESLPQAIESAGNLFPPVYKALVQAGMRTGRLDLVLTSMSRSGTRLAELRRTVGMAFLYPLAVVLLAYQLFVFLITRILPQFVIFSEGKATPLLRALEHAGQTAWYWGPIFPCASSP